MTLNLEKDIDEQVRGLDPTNWTVLQAEVCMRIAHGKLDAFAVEAHRLAEMVRYGLLTRSIAADYLHEAATYNQLMFEYGMDHIQAIMATAFDCEAA